MTSPVENFIKWIQGKEVDWSGLIPELPEFDGSLLQKSVDLIISIVETGWNVLSGVFDKIIAGAGKLGEAVGAAINLAVEGAEAALNAISGSSGVERIFDQLGGIAEQGWGADFVQGQALTEALAAGEVSLENYRLTLQSVAQEGGQFSKTAREMIEASKQLDNFKMPEPAPPEMPPTQDMDATLKKLGQIETAAKKVPEIVQTAMSAVDSILARVNFTDQGVALMRTLADGIKAGTYLVVDATRAATQQVRDHLPSSPAKTGPLSDIHRLKFGETIAASINRAPMVAAMRNAAAATMAAALPVTGQMAVAAHAAVPQSAAEARSAQATFGSGRRAGSTGANESGRTINVTYGDINIGQGSPETARAFADEMARHRRELKKLIDREDARERRKRF